MGQKDDEIPTLDEVIFPGHPDKVAEQAATSEDRETRSFGTRERPATTQPSHERPSQPRPGNFETLIREQIDTILEKHIEAAREEIVRVVMLELRSRLPAAQKRPKS